MDAVGITLAALSMCCLHFRCLRRIKEEIEPYQATKEWRRLEARIYSIVARTPPDNPCDSSATVVAEAYFNEGRDSATVIIYSSSVQYATKLRNIINRSGVLNQGKLKFTVEKPRLWDEKSLEQAQESRKLIVGERQQRKHGKDSKVSTSTCQIQIGEQSNKLDV